MGNLPAVLIARRYCRTQLSKTVGILLRDCLLCRLPLVIHQGRSDTVARINWNLWFGYQVPPELFLRQDFDVVPVVGPQARFGSVLRLEDCLREIGLYQSAAFPISARLLNRQFHFDIALSSEYSSRSDDF